MKELILETLKIYDSDDLRWVENGVTVGFGFIPKDTKKRCLKNYKKWDMTEEEYKERLKIAPEDHFSQEFVQWLANNNKKRYLSNDWLVIENCKYYNQENDWLTAFYIGEQKQDTTYAFASIEPLVKRFSDREWLIKAPHKRTIKLFHVHLYKKTK